MKLFWIFLLTVLFAACAQTPPPLNPALVGGYSRSEINARVVAAAGFAVRAEAAKNETRRDEPLELVQVLSAQTQVVAGTNYWLRLKVGDQFGERQAEAFVYERLDGTLALTSWRWL